MNARTYKKLQYWRGLTATQAGRLKRRMLERIGSDGYPSYGWDWPTLRVMHPDFYSHLRIAPYAQDTRTTP